MNTYKLLFGAALTVAAFGMNAASAIDIQLPQETATYKPSSLPGYQLVQQNCMICHSAHYVQTQPVSSRAYWEATVKKMKHPFGAPFSDQDIPAMVDYLVKTYGTEKNASAATAQKGG